MKEWNCMNVEKTFNKIDLTKKSLFIKCLLLWNFIFNKSDIKQRFLFIIEMLKENVIQL